MHADSSEQGSISLRTIGATVQENHLQIIHKIQMTKLIPLSYHNAPPADIWRQFH